jgi:hypothetical protein
MFSLLDVVAGARRHLNISEALSGEYAAIHLFPGIPDDVKNPSTDTARCSFLGLPAMRSSHHSKMLSKLWGCFSGSFLSQV